MTAWSISNSKVVMGWSMNLGRALTVEAFAIVLAESYCHRDYLLKSASIPALESPHD